MMTTSLYCPSPDGEPVVDCRRQKTERRSSAEATKTSVNDGGEWCSQTLGRTHRRCRCRCTSEKLGTMGDELTTADGVKHNETLPRFKSPVLGRRLRSLVADDQSASVASGSVSCPGSPRDIARLSAVVGRRLHLGLSPRLGARRTHRRAEASVGINFHPPYVTQVCLSYHN